MIARARGEDKGGGGADPREGRVRWEFCHFDGGTKGPPDSHKHSPL